MTDKKRNERDNRSPEEIEREIEGTREKLAEDLDDLGEKVSPENLKQQAKGAIDDATDAVAGGVDRFADDIKNRTESAGNRIVKGIREEPLPVAALLGVLAAGYMLMEARESGSGRPRTRSRLDTNSFSDAGAGRYDREHTGESMMESVQNDGLLLAIGAVAVGAAVGLALPAGRKLLHQARETLDGSGKRVSEAVGNMQDKLGDTIGNVQDKVSEAIGSAKSKVGEMSEGARKSGASRGSGIQVRERVRVNKSAADLYRFWRNLENLPQVMSHLKEVTTKTGKRSHWVAKGPLNMSVEWDAMITSDRPNESIAWNSDPDSQVETEGAVSFRSISPGSTDIIVSMTFHPPAGALGEKVSKLFGEDPSEQISDDLERFKHEVESGRLSLAGGSSAF